jgi:low temperature requirement protein LtrA
MSLVPRARAALNGFGYWHLPMLLGIVTIASAERRAFAHPFDALNWSRASILAGGVAIFLAGDVLYRRELSLGPAAIRSVAAGLAISTATLGATTFATAQVAALVALLVSVIVLESKVEVTGITAESM